MLSSVSHSAYICSQCRSRLSRNILQISRPIRGSTFRGLASLSQLQNFVSTAASRLQDDVLTYEQELDLRHVRFNSDKSRPWESVGLRPIVADTLLRAYPNAERPTIVQKKMLTALTYGYSVAARGLSGTGKSFAIAAWLLGLERAIREEQTETGAKRMVPTTSALVLVPNVDLAVQYYNTIINMLDHSGSDIIRSSPDLFVQLLYRKSNETELEQLVKLQQYPHPHIIVAPPTIILDILADKEESVRSLIDVTNLRVIVLEEIDASISQLQFFSKMKRPKFMDSWQNKQVPLQVLLDYIIKCRMASAVKKRTVPQQPQLVFPTSTLSATQIKRFLILWHRNWLHSHDLQSIPETFTGIPGDEWKRKARSNSLLSIEEPPLRHDKLTKYVPDHIRHHVVAYDLRSGTLRDAPLPVIDHVNKENLAEDINELGDSLDRWDSQPDVGRVTTYPENIIVSIVGKLLEHDNYPTNVIVAVSPETHLNSLRDKLNAAGIKSRALIAVKWDDDRERGKLHVGRTDMLLSPSVRKKIEDEGKGGDKDETTVWITSFFFCRGLQLPGVRHLYILHRLARAREYITYAGRVASWPYATLEDELKDPRSLGKDRRGVGKVVSVILEDNLLDNPDREPESVRFQAKKKVHHTMVESMVVTSDGSQKEKLDWANEAVRLAKLGCKPDPYFTVEDKPNSGATDASSAEGGVNEGKDKAPEFLLEALKMLDDSQEPSESKTEAAEEPEKGE